MRKLYKNVFSVLMVASALTLSQSANAQFGCGSAVVVSDGYTASGITTPGTGGAEDWNTNPTGTSISGSYWDDDVYLFEYTAGATTENISMTIFTRNSWNGIGIFDDCTGTTFSNELDADGSSGTGVSRTVSATIAAGNTVYIAVGQWGTPNDLDFDVTDFTVTPISCSAPTALTAANVTATSADLGWTENGSATDWIIEVGAPGFTPSATALTSTNPYAASGLSAATDYEFYVRAYCGIGDTSSWAGPFAFSTPCAPIVGADLQDFSAFVPACWDEAGDGNPTSMPSDLGNGLWNHTDYLNAGGANDAAKINLYTTNRTDWILSPTYDLSAGGPYELKLEVGVTTYNGTGAIAMGSDDQVQVVVSTDGGATWTVLHTWNTANTPSNLGETQLIDLTAYSLSNVSFGIWASDGSVNDAEDYDFHVGSFEIRLPPACADPSALTATNITGTSADLGWTENGSATDWIVEVGAPGFTPSASTLTSTNPFNATGLTPNSNYEFYVRAYCGIGDTSTWIGPFAFTTPCAAVVAPWTESFDATSMPSCWSMAGPEPWLFTTTWSDYGADNLADHTGNGGSYAGVDGSSGINAGVELFSPMIDASGLTQPTLEFYYFSNNTDFPTQFNSLIVDAWDGAAWVRLDSIAQHDPNWQYNVYYLNGYMTITGDIQVRFTVDQTSNPGSAFYNDQIIDDVSIYDGPTCPGPGNLMADWIDNDSVIVSWTIGASETMWNIELGAAGFTPGTGTEMYAGNSMMTSDTIGGLMQVTDYDVYVQSDCGPDSSTWEGPISFTTLPNCSAPTGLTAMHINADSVSVMWTAGGSETDWAIEYGPSGFTPGMGMGTILNVSGNPSDTLTGLGLSQTYDFYLVGLCSPTDSSLWVGPSTVAMPLGNDDPCDAIMLPVDGIARFFSAIGATAAPTEQADLAIPGTNCSSNDAWCNSNVTFSTWFTFVAPASGNIVVSSTESSFDGQLALFADTANCGDFTTFGLIAANDDFIGLAPELSACGLTPGNTYYVMYDSWSTSSAASSYAMQLTEIVLNAGTSGSADVCETDMVDLNSVVSITNSNGFWDFALNPSAISNDSIFNAGSVPNGTHIVTYYVQEGCAVDSAQATLNIVAPASSGMAVVPFNACNSDVYLPDGLSGAVDAGGTWSDDSGTGLLAGPNGNVFVAAGVPAGTYPFTYEVDNGVCPPSETTVEVIISDCSGIGENTAEMSMYPNPNNGNFNILSNVTGENNIVITDISGKVVYNTVVGLTAGTPFEITLDNVETGMYMINISNATGSNVMTMIVK